jgi:uncharacterized protein
MFGPEVWAGLTGSGFLADVSDRDRDPARIAATVIGGVFIGFVAAFACWILVLVPYTLVTGLGGEGLKGLARTAAMFEDPDARGLSVTLLRLLESTVTDGIFPVAFVALAGLLAGHPFHHYLTMAAKVRWRLLAAGLVLAAVAMAPLIVTERLLAPADQMLPIAQITPSWSGRFVYGLSALLLIPAAAAEELMFRGWLLRQVAAFTRRPAPLIGLTALMFSAAHFDFAPGAFLTRTLMGVGFAYMTLRLGGIEFSTGAHAANNILIVLFIEPLTFQPPAASSDLSGGALLEDVVLVVGYVLITEAVVRIAALRRWSGLAAEEIAPHAVGAAGLP